MGDIAAAASLASTALNIFNTLQNQPQGSDAISPQQAALAQYTEGENILKNQSLFANTGTGLSTGKTLANAGSAFGAATSAAKMSDINLQATSQVAQDNLTNLASNAGFNSGFGSSSGSAGNTGGSDSGSVS